MDTCLALIYTDKPPLLTTYMPAINRTIVEESPDSSITRDPEANEFITALGRRVYMYVPIVRISIHFSSRHAIILSL